MPVSGIPVAEECISAFLDLKMKRKYKFITFKMNSTNTEIIVDRAFELSHDEGYSEDEAYNAFVKSLPPNECRYAVYDLKYTEDMCPRSKIMFYSWVPDTCSVKEKIIFASSQDLLSRQLEGLHTVVQATDEEEVQLENAMERLHR